MDDYVDQEFDEPDDEDEDFRRRRMLKTVTKLKANWTTDTCETKYQRDTITS